MKQRRKVWAFVTGVTALLAAMGGPAAFAQDEGRVEAEKSEFQESVFDRLLHVGGRAGVLSYENLQEQDADDFLIGGTIDWNISQMQAEQTPFIYGFSTGFFYSPLEDAADENAFILPLEGFGGYRFTEQLTGVVYGGGKIFFQGDTPGLQLHRDTGGTEIVPSVGLQLGYQITRDIALTGRVDWAFGGDSIPFGGGLGVELPLPVG